MHMNIGTVRMLYKAAVQDAGTLMLCNVCLGMNAEMQAVEIENTIPEFLLHGKEKSLQRFSLMAAFNSLNATVLDLKLYRLGKIW